MPGPTAVTRASGGMRQNFGFKNIDSEHMEQQAMQGAVAQKALQQQSSNSPTKQSAQSQTQKPQKTTPPREVGSLKQELVTRPIEDIKKELHKFVDLNLLLGIDPTNDTPEKQAKKKQLHARYQQLTEAEQKVARERYQQKLQQEQEEEKQQQAEKKKAEQQKQANIAPPSSVSKKPGLIGVGKGSKGKAMGRLQQQIRTMGVVGGAN
jgi:hypothetical protein